MNRLRLIAVTNLCVFFIVFAGTASGEQSKAGPFAPLVDIYDTTWVRSEDGSVKSLEQVADERVFVATLFFHGSRHRGDLALGELADGIAEHRLFFGERRQGRGRVGFGRHVVSPVGLVK